ncbi:MAG: transport protein TonB [Rariglobus sp.]|jgi:TonB family protein|nr:transport protein TonB [Rariglobus sp.]
MLAPTSRPFVFSVLLHVAVAAVMLVVMLRVLPEPAPEPRVIEVMPNASVLPPTPAPGPSTVVFTPVRVAASVRVQPSVADAGEQGHTVEPPQARPSSVVVRTTDTPPSLSSRPTTLAEHRRSHPVRTPSSHVVTGPGTPRIDVGAVLSESRPNTETGGLASDGGQTASYLERLVARLRAAHERPAGLDGGLQTQVEFTLREDGRVGDARVVRSSGSDAFDASVLAAFRRLLELGRPPKGLVGTNRITFRVQEN